MMRTPRILPTERELTISRLKWVDQLRVSQIAAAVGMTPKAAQKCIERLRRRFPDLNKAFPFKRKVKEDEFGLSVAA